MMKIFQFTLPLIPTILFSQNNKHREYVQKFAIPLNFHELSKGEQLYDSIRTYNLIMVGELHGTKEPMEFVEYLAKIFIAHGKKVQVGLEIVQESLGNQWEKMSKRKLMKSPFFPGTKTGGKVKKSVILSFATEEPH